jgi:DNA repair protein RadA/Sms
MRVKRMLEVMAKPRKTFTCTNCGHLGYKWFNECPECGNIALPVEGLESEDKTPQLSRVKAAKATTVSRDLGDVEPGEFTHDPTCFAELNRVLGGGIVHGAYILLAAEPGAGKSTITNQLINDELAKGKKVGIVLGEESALQVRMRFDRLELEARGVRVLTNEDNLEVIAATIAAEGWDFAVIDSIQTMRRSDISGEAGQPAQVNACSVLLQDLAKNHDCSVVLIGHSTKANSVAGPQHLKHIVDVVLTLEGEERTHYRIVRALKNRFGPTDEIGVLAMDETGLHDADGSLMFMAGRTEAMIGSVVCPVLQGTRVILVEVQALVNPAIGSAARIPDGITKPRLQQLLAVLERHAGLEVSTYDVYVRLADGLRVDDPGLDLAICLAVTSAMIGRAIPLDMVAYGEVSLVGQVRPAIGAKRREAEAVHRQLTRIIGGAGVSSINEALNAAGMTG